MQKQFVYMYKEISGLHEGITTQTKWMIGLIGFVAIALKLIETIFK